MATKIMAAVTETAIILVEHSPKSVWAGTTSVEQWGPRPIRYETADALLSPLVAPQPGTFYSSDDIDKVDHLVEYTSKPLQTKTFYKIPLVLAEQSCSELVRQFHDYPQDSAQ